MQRFTRIDILCEDEQHESFLRHFIKEAGLLGSHEQVYVEKSPRGDAAAYVRRHYPDRLKSLRWVLKTKTKQCLLVVMTDADVLSVDERRKTLDKECDDIKVPPRVGDEPVAVFIPKRAVETWLTYLGGQEVNEAATYPDLDEPGSCGPQVKALWQMCSRNQLRQPSPPSLETACAEYKRVRQLFK